MNKLKKIIIIMLILTLIIAIVLAILIIFNINKEQNAEVHIEKGHNEATVDATIITKLYNNIEYLIVKDCIDSYIMFSQDLLYSQDSQNTQVELMNKRMLSIIPDFVQESLNINSENLYEIVGLPDKKMRIDNINVSRQITKDKDEILVTNVYAYIVEGVLIDREDFSKEDFKLIVLLDKLNETFYIIPQKYIENERNNLEEGSQLEIYSQREINNNTYNTYQPKAYTDQNICEEYFNLFRLNLVYDTEYVYNKLNEEYKQKRFENYNNFVNYIQENNLKNIKIQSYLVNRNDNYNEYVCKDQYGNLYVFKEIAVMKYTLTLDTYTLEQPKFNQEYEKATNQKKVMMNIDKFFQMINAKDYKAAYSVLDDTFKNNYFKTEEDFKNYMKQRVFSYNDVEYVNYEGEISSIYKYDLTLKNRLDDAQETDFSIVMQLKEGTDFVMSFNIQ